MPRANRYRLAGHVGHLTERCHRQQFLLKFARDRQAWINGLYQARQRDALNVLNYQVTSNHMHRLVLGRGEGAIAHSMQLIAGGVGPPGCGLTVAPTRSSNLRRASVSSIARGSARCWEQRTTNWRRCRTSGSRPPLRSAGPHRIHSGAERSRAGGAPSWTKCNPNLVCGPDTGASRSWLVYRFYASRRRHTDIVLGTKWRL